MPKLDIIRPMKIAAQQGNLQDQAADLLIVNLFQGVTKPGGGTGAVDQALGGLLTNLIKDESFAGKLGQTLLVHTQGKIPAKKVLLVGLGKKDQLSLEKVRRAAGSALKAAKKVNSKSIVSILHGAGEGKLDAQETAYAIATGSLLADYSFTKYQKEKAKEESKRAVKSFTLVDHNQPKAAAAARGIKRALSVLPGVKLARDLVNEPGLEATPTRLVNEAQAISKLNPNITCKVFDEKELKKMGAGALLAIARGSDEPAYLIHLTYKPKSTPKKKIALLGKGLTFDAGGYSLKPVNYIETMKLDMGGAATVLGIFKTLSDTKPQVELHGIIPTTENLISGGAIKPGDVVTALNGKTIEVVNTDAEGRMILADAFSYIAKNKWDAVIDFATLTGSCMVALGDQIAGLFSNDKKIQREVTKAADQEGEDFWPLPLVADYKKQLKSPIADIQNISKSKWGGAITAALFLQEFVPASTPWVHLDIAGPAFAEKASRSYIPVGGTGFAIRTILRFLKRL